MNLLKILAFVPALCIFLCSCKDSHKEENFCPIVNDSAKILSPKNKSKLQSIKPPKGVQIIVETVSHLKKDTPPHKFADDRFDFYDDKYADSTGFDKRGLFVLICRNPHLVQIRLGSDYKNRNIVFGYTAGEKYYDIQKNVRKKGLTETALSLVQLNISGINEKESAEQDIFTNTCYYISDGISVAAMSVNYLIPPTESWQSKLFHCITIPTEYLAKYTKSWAISISIIGLFFSFLFYIILYRWLFKSKSILLLGLLLFQFVIFACVLYIIWGCLLLYSFPKMETDNIRSILGIPLLMNYPWDMHLLHDINSWVSVFPFLLIIIYTARYVQPISCGMFLEKVLQNRIAVASFGDLWIHYRKLFPENYTYIGDVNVNTTKEKVEEEIRRDGYFSLIASNSISAFPGFLQGIMLIILFFPNPFLALIVIFYFPKFIYKLLIFKKHHNFFDKLNNKAYQKRRESVARKSVLTRSYGTTKQGTLARTYAPSPSDSKIYCSVMPQPYPKLPYTLIMCIGLPALGWAIITESLFAFFSFWATPLVQWIKSMF